MSIIKCPVCGQSVDDQIAKCPNCGTPIAGRLVKCNRCGNVYFTNLSACPQCNEPNPNYNPAGGMAGGRQTPPAPPVPPKKNNGKIVAIVVVALLIIFAGGFYFYQQHEKSNDEQQAYELVMKSTSAQELQDYLDKYPDADPAHREAVEQRLKEIKELESDWNDTLVNDSKTAYLDFLSKHPDAP